MKILVMGRESAEKFKSNEKYIVISITSPRSSPAKICITDKCRRILRLSFHDWDIKDKEHISQMNTLEAKKMIYFSEDDARQILNFVEAYKDEVNIIVVHCEAGISRSAAVAGAIAKCYYEDDSYYFNRYLPNMLVYSTILKVYEERLCD